MKKEIVMLIVATTTLLVAIATAIYTNINLDVPAQTVLDIEGNCRVHYINIK